MYTASNCTVVTDDTVVECTSLPGVGTPTPLLAAVQNLTFAAPLVAYGVPCLSSVSGRGATAASTIGGDVVVLTGQNLGPIGTPLDYVMYGPGVTPSVAPTASSAGVYTAVNCAVTVAHTEVRCVTAPAVGSRHVRVVAVARQVSGVCVSAGGRVADITSSYGGPSVDSVTVVTSHDAPSGLLQTEGGTVLAVRGWNFGRRADASVFLADEPVEVWTLVNDTLMYVAVPPGSGVGKQLRVVVGDQYTVAPALLAYEPPTVTLVTTFTGTLLDVFIDCCSMHVWVCMSL